MYSKLDGSFSLSPLVTSTYPQASSFSVWDDRHMPPKECIELITVTSLKDRNSEGKLKSFVY